MQIHNGDALPEIRAELDGETIDLAEAAAGSWTAVLLYRGHW